MSRERRVRTSHNDVKRQEQLNWCKREAARYLYAVDLKRNDPATEKYLRRHGDFEKYKEFLKAKVQKIKDHMDSRELRSPYKHEFMISDAQLNFEKDGITSEYNFADYRKKDWLYLIKNDKHGVIRRKLSQFLETPFDLSYTRLDPALLRPVSELNFEERQAYMILERKLNLEKHYLKVNRGPDGYPNEVSQNLVDIDEIERKMDVIRLP